MKQIRLLRAVYANSPQGSYGDKLSRALNSYVYPNGQPLNILQGIYVLNAMGYLVTCGHAKESDYNKVLSNVSFKTGYSKKELIERIGG